MLAVEVAIFDKNIHLQSRYSCYSGVTYPQNLILIIQATPLIGAFAVNTTALLREAQSQSYVAFP